MASKALDPPAQSIHGFVNQTLPELDAAHWVFGECLHNEPNHRVFALTCRAGHSHLAQEVRLFTPDYFSSSQHIYSSVYAFQHSAECGAHKRFVPLLGLLRRSATAAEAFLVQGPIDPRRTLQSLLEGRQSRSMELVSALGEALMDVERWLFPAASAQAEQHEALRPHPSRVSLRLHPSNIIVEPSGRVRFLSLLVFPLYLSHDGKVYARYTIFDAPECENLARPRLHPCSLPAGQALREHPLNPIVPQSLCFQQYVYSLGMLAVYLMLGTSGFGEKVNADMYSIRGFGTVQLIGRATESQPREMANLLLEALSDDPDKRPSLSSFLNRFYAIHALQKMPHERLIRLTPCELSAFLNELGATRMAAIVLEMSITPPYFLFITEDEITEQPYSLSPQEVALIRPFFLPPEEVSCLVSMSDPQCSSADVDHPPSALQRLQQSAGGSSSSLSHFKMLSFQEDCPPAIESSEPSFIEDD